MKRFLIQTSILTLFVLLSFGLIISRTDGCSDNFYLRFTSPVQKSLIIGTSRAAQGLLPDILNFETDFSLYNYSFTVIQSPYGPAYYNSIVKKVDPKSKNGLFLVTIDPWSIASDKTNPEDSTLFRETNLCVANTPFVAMNPNFFYLVNNNSFGKYIKPLFLKEQTVCLHNDGWLEISVDIGDSAEIEGRIEKKVALYRATMLPKNSYSDLRMKYLLKTIAFLKKHGRVYLIRLPIHPSIMAIEDELMPDFNNKIQKAVESSNGYLNLTSYNKEMSYTDGNHLDLKSAKHVSEKVKNWVQGLK
jgi:hypothetical protein